MKTLDVDGDARAHETKHKKSEVMRERERARICRVQAVLRSSPPLFVLKLISTQI